MHRILECVPNFSEDKLVYAPDILNSVKAIGWYIEEFGRKRLLS
jgi:hypothetical protein